MAITADAQQLTVPLEKIHVPGNVRSLDVEHVQALAGSIRLQGVLVPVVVTPAAADVAEGGWEFELAAGFHRVAAAAQLGLTEVPVVVRLGETVDSDRAIENIARKNLRADDEARAVKAMLDRGFSEDGAAQALGWPRQRVTARMKLLELPDRARELVGAGVIALSTVDELRTIGQISPPLLEVLIDYVDGAQDDWPARQLSSDPGRVLGEALRHTNRKVFAAYLNQIGSRELEQLRLGKTTTTLLAEAETLHKQFDRYAYGPPTIRFAEQDVDEARAAGVLIELERSQPIIVDRALYRELAKGAVKRTTEQLRAKAAAAKSEKRSIRAKTGAPADPIAEARREHGRQLRELADQAHGANLDLGGNLLTGLASVDPASMDVARLFTFGLLGGDYDGSPYTSSGDRVAELAMRGIRLVIDEFRTDVTKTRKDGSRGRLRIDYGDPRQPRERDQMAVEVPGRRPLRRRLVWPRDRGPGRRAVRLPARAPLDPAARRAALALPQGPRPQSTDQARRPAPAGHAQAAREGDREGTQRLRARPRGRQRRASCRGRARGTERSRERRGLRRRARPRRRACGGRGRRRSHRSGWCRRTGRAGVLGRRPGVVERRSRHAGRDQDPGSLRGPSPRRPVHASGSQR